MAKCKNCEKSGLFLSVTENGLCRSCDPIVVIEVQQRLRIINDSRRIVDESKKLETRVGRCDLIIEFAQELYQYEEKGIPTIDPPPSAFVRVYSEKKDEIIVETLEAEAKRAKEKAVLTSSLSTKKGYLTKALLKVREYREKYPNIPDLARLEDNLTQDMHRAELDDHLEAARKAEFKGDKKKALDRYYDAVYFLRRDDVKDSLEEDIIGEIERKVKELGGSLEEPD